MKRGAETGADSDGRCGGGGGVGFGSGGVGGR